MDWDALGAIGEVIGALAVVATLVYLAAQIRQNTKTVAANTFQSVSATASQTALQIAQSPDLVRVTVKLFQPDEELTIEEAMQAQLIFRAVFRNYENYYYQYSRGYFEEEVWGGYKKTMSEQLAVPFGQQWWKNHQAAFGISFVEFVNRELLGRDLTSVPWVATHRNTSSSPSNESGD